MQKICLVIPSLHSGGMERVMCELANYFAKTKAIETHLIILGKGENFYEISNNVIIHEPNFYFNKKFRIYYTLKTILFLRSRIKILNPYSILSFGEMYNSFVILATLFLKVKVYLSDRSKPNKNWGFLHNNLRRILYKRSFGIISQTKFSALYLKQIINHKNIHIIPNPVKIPIINNFESQNIVLTVSRLVYSKRLDLLLQIFAETSLEDYKLWIVGDGPELINLKTIAIKLGIEHKVIFWGSKKDVENFYNKSKIFAFTSVSEGFPNAILEALSHGLPAIAFDCIAGPSDLIENGKNGFLIPEFDIELYKVRLKELSNELKRKEMAKYALISSKKYDIQNIGKIYLKTLLS